MAKPARLTTPAKNVSTQAKLPAAEPKGDSLKGTFVAVLLLGGFIILTWLGVFLLFLVRQ